MSRSRPRRRFPKPFRLFLPPLIVAIALASPAMAAAPGLPNGATAAKSCARGRSIDARLGTADVAYVSRLLPCVLRAERAQLGLGFAQSRFISRSVAKALKQFIASALLNQGMGSDATAWINRTNHLIGRASCPARLRYTYASDAFDSNPPPVLTPRSLAGETARLFNKYPVMHSASLTFGLAIRRGVMFKGNDLDGVATDWIAVRCG